MGAADAPISLSIDVAHQFAPGRITYTIHVSPHRDNVMLCTGYENITYGESASSCRPIDGQNDPPTSLITWKSLPAGEYEGYAELYRAPQYLVSRVHRSFIVLDNDQHP